MRSEVSGSSPGRSLRVALPLGLVDPVAEPAPFSHPLINRSAGPFVRILAACPRASPRSWALWATALLGCAPQNQPGRSVTFWPGMMRACGSQRSWLAGFALKTTGGGASRCSTATTTPPSWIWRPAGCVLPIAAAASQEPPPLRPPSSCPCPPAPSRGSGGSRQGPWPPAPWAPRPRCATARQRSPQR